MSSPIKNPIDLALSKLLEALAVVLIPLEVTPARLSQIARSSFVKASATQARMRSSGRPHLAKIAALTGLTRSEVKRIVAENFQPKKSATDSDPRALRVLKGWEASAPYARAGIPRELKIHGKPPSFESLCKKFSGDIPGKVILDELLRRNRIAINHETSRVSITRSHKGARPPHSELAALEFAAAFLSEVVRSDDIVVRRNARVRISKENSNAQVEAALSDRLNELFDQLPRSYVSKRRSSRHILNAYALVARTKPHAIKA